MWNYSKKLEYPVKIGKADPAMAKLILSQFGGPDGELGAATRYLSQRYGCPTPEVKGLLTDIGTEEPFCDLRRFSSTKVHFCGKRLR